MRLPLLIGLMMLHALVAWAQRIQWESTSYNFGTVRDWDSPPAVFRLTNTGSTKLMFLPQHYGRDVQVVLPNRSIAPGESAEVIIHYYTPQSGSFSKDVEVYSNASDRPQRLTVRGNIASLRNNALTACPTFSEDQPARSTDVSTITVVDRSTGEQVVGARVELFKKNDSRAVYTTDDRGLVRSKLEMGRFTAQVQHERYFPTVQEIVLERRQGTQVIFLEPRKAVAVSPPARPVTAPVRPVREERAGEEPPINLGISLNDQLEQTVPHDRWADAPPSQPKPAPAPVPEPELDLGIAVNDQFDEPPAPSPAPSPAPVTAAPRPAPQPAAQPDPAVVVEEPEFSEKRFRPNNIVLLLDVSSSMNKDRKLERLKAAAARLIGMMRPIDRLTVLAFNMTVFTVVPPTPVTAPELLIDEVMELVAEGYTSGVKGMREAYAQLAAEWVEGGNNQLILVTDGMFNSSSFTEKDAIKMAADHADRGIILSVAGYSGDESAERMMRRIAKRGKGSYLRLDAQDGAIEVLAEEIRERSRRPVAAQ